MEFLLAKQILELDEIQLEKILVKLKYENESTYNLLQELVEEEL